MSKISIIIVNWNTGDLLARCLRSLINLPAADRSLLNQIVIVDNNSEDDSLAKAQAEVANDPIFKFLEPRKNLGFAGGNNLALKYLANQGAAEDHVWLLNPDTEVKPHSLVAQIQLLTSKPDVGIIGARLINPDGTHQASIRPFPTLPTFLLYALKLGRLVKFPNYDYTREQIVDQVMGATFLIRAETKAETGLLDESFFVWFEEVDYCRRALSAGWKTLYTPVIEVIHYGGISFHQLAGFKKSLPWLKSSLVYTRKHLGLLAWLTLLAITPLTLLLMLPANFRHNRQRQSSYAKSSS